MKKFLKGLLLTIIFFIQFLSLLAQTCTSLVSPITASKFTPIPCADLKAKVDAFVAQGGLVQDKAALTVALNTAFNKNFPQSQYEVAFKDCQIFNDYLALNGSSYVDFGKREYALNDFTAEAWIYTPSTVKGEYTQTILSNIYYDYNNGTYKGMFFGIDENKLTLILSNGFPTEYVLISSTNNLTLDTWHHIVAQRIGNTFSNFKLYIDGQEVTFSSLDNNIGLVTNGDINNRVEPMKIGALNTSDGVEYYLTGNTKQVRLYNRILTSDEILSSYQGGGYTSPTNRTNLVLWAPLDDQSGPSVQDYSDYKTVGTFNYQGTGSTWHRDINTTNCTTCIAGLPLLTNPSSSSNPTQALAGESYIYNIDPVANATTYNWQVDIPGARITSGQNTNQITVFYASDPNGSISIDVTNTCSLITSQTVAVITGGGALTPVGIIPNDATGNSYNYITENTILVPITDPTQLGSLDITQMSQKTIYLDGLGRPIQNVITKGSPNKQDMVLPIEYDAFGRRSKQYLPYVSNETNGVYKPNALGNTGMQASFYSSTPDIANDALPYSETIFENSPFNRITEQGAPGDSWKVIKDNVGNSKQTGNTQQKNEYINNAGQIRLWRFDFVNQLAYSNPVNDFYGAGLLWVTEIKDENGFLFRSYKDKNGRLICKKAQIVKLSELADDWTETHYIYDDFGNTIFVLPPESVKNLSTSLVYDNLNYTIKYYEKPLSSARYEQEFFTFNNFIYSIFTYKYDERHRLIENQVPNSGTTFFVYDVENHLVLSQDEKQRVNKQWTFIKYDIFSRPIIHGLYNLDKSSRSDIQVIINAQTGPLFETRQANTSFGYSTNVFPTTNIIPHIINYYDDYDFNLDGIDDVTYQNINSTGTAPGFLTSNSRAEDELTGTKTLVLDGNDNKYLINANFNDEFGRTIQIQSDNILGGRELNTIRYDFTGKPLESRLMHNQKSLVADRTIISSTSYDHAGRVIANLMQVNGENIETIGTYKYNTIGQLQYKQVGNDLQKIDFKYNIRGWLTQINDINQSPSVENDLFSMQMQYDKNGLFSQYNGNISSIATLNSSGVGNDAKSRLHQYNYDGLNRLISTTYQGPNGSNESFSMPNISYDKNGNITSLQRNNLIGIDSDGVKQFGLVDNLIYSYNDANNSSNLPSGNQVLSVTDNSVYVKPTDALADDFSITGNSTASNQYNYDVNGNLQVDRNKDISSIKYNFLNLPEMIIWLNGNYIQNIYSASGEKLISKVVTQNVITKQNTYVGGLVYESDNGLPGKLQFIPSAEGRVLTPEVTGKNGHIFEYYYKDQVGNLRVAFRKGDQVTYNATMEDVNLETETAQWNINYLQTRNNEQACTGTYSAKVDNNNPIGPWMTQKIGKGDVLTFTARPLYFTQPSAFRAKLGNTIIQTLATGLLTSVAGGTPPDKNGVPYSALSTGLQIPINNVLNSFTFNNNQIKAYIMYIVFDKDMHYISSNKQVVDNASLGNCSSTLQLSYQAIDDGYVQVMVVNESDTPVWFDDISLKIQQSLVTQENHYDAFGLSLSGIEKVGALKNNYKFNDMTERIEDFNLHLDQTDFRMYDPQLGRFHGIDALAENCEDCSPYSYGFNNPILYFDSDGLLPTIKLPKVVGGFAKSSSFGNRILYGKPDWHPGTDFLAPIGTPILAFARGKVVEIRTTDESGGYGNLIIIQHKDGYFTFYAHLNSINVKVGDPITNGKKIGESGATGNKSTGPHAHIEVVKTPDNKLSQAWNNAYKVDAEKFGDLDVYLYGNGKKDVIKSDRIDFTDPNNEFFRKGDNMVQQIDNLLKFVIDQRKNEQQQQIQEQIQGEQQQQHQQQQQERLQEQQDRLRDQPTGPVREPPSSREP